MRKVWAGIVLGIWLISPYSWALLDREQEPLPSEFAELLETSSSFYLTEEFQAKDLLHLAKDLLDQQRYLEAMDILDKLLELEPDHKEAQRLKRVAQKELLNEAKKLKAQLQEQKEAHQTEERKREAITRKQMEEERAKKKSTEERLVKQRQEKKLAKKRKDQEAQEKERLEKERGKQEDLRRREERVREREKEQEHKRLVREEKRKLEGEKKEKIKQEKKKEKVELPDRAAQLYNQAKDLIREKRFEAAKEKLKEVVHLAPTHPWAPLLLERVNERIQRETRKKEIGTMLTEREQVKKEEVKEELAQVEEGRKEGPELTEANKGMERSQAAKIAAKRKKEEVQLALKTSSEKKKEEKVVKEAKGIKQKLSMPVTVYFRDVTLLEVLNYLGIVTDINIIPSQKVIQNERKITIRLKDMSLESALRYVLRGQSLTYRVEESAIWVADRGESD